MHWKVPVFNVVDFLVIFLILYFLDLVSLMMVGIATVIGFVVGLIIEFIFHRRDPNVVHHRKIPTKVSTKLFIIPTVLLVLLVTVVVMSFTGVGPFEFSGHTTAEDVSDDVVEEEVDEEVVEEEEEVEEEDSGEVCTISDKIMCLEHKVEGEYKRATLVVRNDLSYDMVNIRAYVNELKEDRFLCKLYCTDGCLGSNSDTLRSGGTATFVGDQYCRFESSGELMASTKFVYDSGQTGLGFVKLGDLRTTII